MPFRNIPAHRSPSPRRSAVSPASTACPDRPSPHRPWQSAPSPGDQSATAGLDASRRSRGTAAGSATPSSRSACRRVRRGRPQPVHRGRPCASVRLPSGRVSDQRRPSMPGRCFHVSMRLCSSGLSSGNQPRMQNRSGYFRGCLDRHFVGSGIPARRMQHRAVHPGRVHLLDQFLGCIQARSAGDVRLACRCPRCGPARRRSAWFVLLLAPRCMGLDAAGATRQTGCGEIVKWSAGRAGPDLADQ